MQKLADYSMKYIFKQGTLGGSQREKSGAMDQNLSMGL